MRNSRYLSAFSVLLLLACGGFRSTLQRYEYRQIHMGVEARLVLYAPDSARAVTAARAAFRRMAELDAIMSDYREDSELMKLAAEPPGKWVPVSEPLWRVLTVAQELARLSSGAFDVTVGPYSLLWREARRTGRFPGETMLQEARGRTGWRHLQLDPASRSVRLNRPGMRLDLGGIAKGFAADEAIAVLRDHGLPRALVEFGGDIAAGEPPPDKGGWEIRLDDPAGAPPVIELANAAISSSGDAAQFVVIEGVRYSHVVDPRNGMPLTGRTAATVIAPHALLSDPLATTVGVLGPEEGPRFLREHYPGLTLYVRRLDSH
jgi:FAD:protein FMN transferase